MANEMAKTVRAPRGWGDHPSCGVIPSGLRSGLHLRVELGAVLLAQFRGELKVFKVGLWSGSVYLILTDVPGEDET